MKSSKKLPDKQSLRKDCDLGVASESVPTFQFRDIEEWNWADSSSELFLKLLCRILNMGRNIAQTI